MDGFLYCFIFYPPNSHQDFCVCKSEHKHELNLTSGLLCNELGMGIFNLNTPNIFVLDLI